MISFIRESINASFCIELPHPSREFGNRTFSEEENTVKSEKPPKNQVALESAPLYSRVRGMGRATARIGILESAGRQKMRSRSFIPIVSVFLLMTFAPAAARAET